MLNVQVLIELANKVHSEVLQFDEESTDSYPWENGSAEFNGLSIQKAGVDYRLKFITDLFLPAGNETVSPPFVVQIGEPCSLVILDEPFRTQVKGGRAFHYQPLLQLVDAGGNVLQKDSSSIVIAQLYNNPTNGTLYPDERRTTSLKNGTIQFRHLSIDKSGLGYRIKYVLWRKNSSGKYNETEIIAYGEI